MIEERQIADVQGERAARAFLVDDDGDGLPSTPSRKPMRQPHARRACVNPFNILKGSYYRSALIS